MNDPNVIFGYTLPYGKPQKLEKCHSINFDEFSKQFLIEPFLLKEYNLFIQNTECSLEQ